MSFQVNNLTFAQSGDWEVVDYAKSTQKSETPEDETPAPCANTPTGTPAPTVAPEGWVVLGHEDAVEVLTPEGGTEETPTPCTATAGCDSRTGIGDTPTPAAVSGESDEVDAAATLQPATPSTPDPRAVETSLPPVEEAAANRQSNALLTGLEMCLSRCLKNALQAIGRRLEKPGVAEDVAAEERARALYGEAIKKDMQSFLDASLAKAKAESADGEVSKAACTKIKSQLMALERFHVNLGSQLLHMPDRVKRLCRKESLEIQQYLMDHMREILSRETVKTRLGELVGGFEVDAAIEEAILAEADNLKLVGAMAEPVKEANVIARLAQQDVVAPLAQNNVMAPLAKVAGMEVEEVASLCGKAVHNAFVAMRSDVLSRTSETTAGDFAVGIDRFYEPVKAFVDEFVASRQAGLQAVDELSESEEVKRLLRRAVLAGIGGEHSSALEVRQAVKDFHAALKGSMLLSKGVQEFCGGEMTAESLKTVVEANFPGTLAAVEPRIDECQEPFTLAQILEVFQKAEAEYLR